MRSFKRFVAEIESDNGGGCSGIAEVMTERLKSNRIVLGLWDSDNSVISSKSEPVSVKNAKRDLCRNLKLKSESEISEKWIGQCLYLKCRELENMIPVNLIIYNTKLSVDQGWLALSKSSISSEEYSFLSIYDFKEKFTLEHIDEIKNSNKKLYRSICDVIKKYFQIDLQSNKNKSEIPNMRFSISTIAINDDFYNSIAQVKYYRDLWEDLTNQILPYCIAPKRQIFL